MIDPTRHERAAMAHAGAMAGEHIESLGRTDLMTWSPEEWRHLIEVIVTAFTDSPARARGEDRSRIDGMAEVPFHAARATWRGSAPRLVDNGYPVLPIMPGTKKPGQFKGGAWRDYPGWTKHGDASDLRARAGSSGAAGRTPASASRPAP